MKPALIVNAGAYTAVDRAETEPALAHAVNGRAPGILAEEAKRLGAVLIHYSTDYVFDGTRTTPYPEDAPTAPLNVYGASKLEGERAIAAAGAHALVLRTSWVYGLRGRNFLLTIRRLAAERDELADRCRPDRRSQLEPHARRGDGAHRRRRIARACRARPGSITCRARDRRAGTTSRARSSAMRARPRVVPITTAEYPTPARRPAYGVLATARFEATFGFALPDWRRGARGLRRESGGCRLHRPCAAVAPARVARASERERASTSVPTDKSRPSPATTIAFIPNVTPPRRSSMR